MKSILEYLINKTTKERQLHPKFNYKTKDYLVCRFKDLNKENCLLDKILYVDTFEKSDDPEVVYVISGSKDYGTSSGNFKIESTGRYLYSGVETMTANLNLCVTLMFHKDVIAEILKELRQDLDWNKNRSIDITYYDKYSKKEYTSKLTANRIRWNDDIIKELVRK